MRTGSVLWSAVVVIGSLFTMCCAYTLSRSKSSKKTKNKKTQMLLYTQTETRIASYAPFVLWIVHLLYFHCPDFQHIAITAQHRSIGSIPIICTYMHDYSAQLKLIQSSRKNPIMFCFCCRCFTWWFSCLVILKAAVSCPIKLYIAYWEVFLFSPQHIFMIQGRLKKAETCFWQYSAPRLLHLKWISTKTHSASLFSLQSLVRIYISLKFKTGVFGK